MSKCVPLEQQKGFAPAEEKPRDPAAPGALDPHSGRRFGGVETIAGGSQNPPKKPAAAEKK